MKKNLKRKGSKAIMISSNATSYSTYNKQRAISMHILGCSVWITLAELGAYCKNEQYKLSF
jgi:hypothetical protein